MSATVSFTIDGRPAEVTEGQSVLDGARKLGLDVPTLCYLERCGPLTTCLVCLVKVVTNGQGRLVPSCGTKAMPGMVVESETDEVHEARRTALELLFSDHVGDCLSPCHRICPLNLNIPVMIRQLQEKRLDEAIATVRHALPLASVLGRLCHAPCENGCRRGTWDQPAAIREMERHVADTDLHAAQAHRPPRRPSSGKSAAIIGAGPTGLSAAYFLALEGHAVTVVDRHDRPGGSLRSVDPGSLPVEILDAELERLGPRGVRFHLGVELGRDVSFERLLRSFDAVLLAAGEMSKQEASSLGLAVTPAGIRIDAPTGLTSVSRVFAAGSVVRPVKQVVRAMGEGRHVALSICQFLKGGELRRDAKPFSSVMGRLEDAELKLFLNGPSAVPRITPSLGMGAGFTSVEAPAEAARCLHCDCRAEGNCALERYGRMYGADPGRFREQRRRFEQHLQHGEIIYEPGKCILCGICVALTEQAREPLGLTFVGRGFDVRVAAPLNKTIAEGLQKVARDCVELCPTGALAFKDQVAGLPLTHACSRRRDEAEPGRS